MTNKRDYNADALRAQELLGALAGLVRASMPGAVREAFLGQLKDLKELVEKTPPSNDSYTRGVWAGWTSLLTELIVRIEREPEPPIGSLRASPS